MLYMGFFRMREPKHNFLYPIAFMYRIFTYTWMIVKVNVGKYPRILWILSVSIRTDQITFDGVSQVSHLDVPGS